MIITQRGEWHRSSLYQAFDGRDGNRVSQRGLPGGGDATVVRRNKPGEGSSWQGALTGQRSGGQKWKPCAVTGTQRGEEEAGAEGWAS